MASNDAIALLTARVAPHLLEPPVNVLRLSLHPEGLAPRIVNLGQWRAHLLERLGRERVIYPALAALHEELVAYPCDRPSAGHPTTSTEIAVPLHVRVGEHELCFISTVTTFGTPTDVTVSELSIESFFSADAATPQYVSAAAGPPAA